jgi:hypothetical protein
MCRGHGSPFGRVADAESEFIEMPDTTSRGTSIYGMKTTTLRARETLFKSLVSIAWMALATGEAQNLAPRAGNARAARRSNLSVDLIVR